MEHGNFTNNNPIVSWRPYPGASGYYVIAYVKERNVNPNKDTESGSDIMAIAYYKYTTDTNVRISSEKISFTPVYSTRSMSEPSINPGDFIRVEVYALDNSGMLDTRRKKGALYMDSLNIIR
jgi:hypothetical protein